MDEASMKNLNAGWIRTARNISPWILGLIVSSALLYWMHSVWGDWTLFQKERNGYMGLQIGATMDEAVYTFGEPNNVLEDAHDPKWKDLMLFLNVDQTDRKNSIPSGETYRDYLDWEIESSGGKTIYLKFDEKSKKITQISCYMKIDTQPHGMCPQIFGITTDQDEEQIIKHLGNADGYKYGDSTKSYKWKSIGLEVWLEKRKSYMIVKSGGEGAGIIWYLENKIF